MSDDAKVSALTAILGSEVDSAADFIPLVDTSEAQTKKIIPSELLLALGSNVLVLPAGSVTAPSLTSTDDLNTGLYWSAADELAIATAGRFAAKFGATGITSLQPLASEATFGSELVANPTFATGPWTNWTPGGVADHEWTYNAGAKHLADTGHTATLVSDSIVLTSAAYYRVVVTITGRTAGTVTLTATNAGVYTFSAASATQTSVFKAASTSTVLTLTPTATFDGTISSVSVKLITAAATNVLSVLNANGGVSGVQFKAGGAGLHNFFSGTNVGNQVTTGIDNIGIGNAVLRYLMTGRTNVALGADCLGVVTTGSFNFAAVNGLGLLTTGSSNIAVGYDSGSYLTTGGKNIALGASSLSRVTTGTNNIAIGENALYNLATSCSENIGIGKSAGFYQANGSTVLAAATDCIYIGNYTKGFSDSDVNAIVIGYDCIGLGANTTVIGPDATHLITQLGGVLSLTGTNTTIPGATANKISLYCADSGAGGTGCLFVKTEAGDVIKLYKQAHIANTAGDDATVVNAILVALENCGLLATS